MMLWQTRVVILNARKVDSASHRPQKAGNRSGFSLTLNLLLADNDRPQEDPQTAWVGAYPVLSSIPISILA